MSARFDANVEVWVNDILSKPKNIAGEVELLEQAKAAFNLFVQADVDGSESLSFEELKSLCDIAGLPMEDDEEEALAKIDRDDSGCLDVEEWVKWWIGRISTLPNPMKQQEAIARNTFRKFDVDGSGFLDSLELGRLTAQLGADFTEEELEEALAEIDADGSGAIEVTEFVSWWTNRAAANRSNTSLISLKMRKLALRAAQVFSTDIFAAAWNGDLDLVKAFLLGESRLANASDSTEYGEGWTALHYACYQGHVAVVQALLGARADANRTNDLGFSALFYAAQRGHIDICALLMDAGADPSITGVYQPIGVLESDGPPPLTGSAVGLSATLPSAGQKLPDEIFMCPVEHTIDFPELRQIFKSSSKCAVPQVPDYDKVTASVSLNNGDLTFEIQQPQKSISHLPVKQWEAKVRMDMQMDTDLVSAEVYADLVAAGLTLTLSRLPAVHPKQLQSYTIQLDRIWIKKLHFLCTLHKMKRLQLLEASLAGLQGIWSELSSIYNTVDPAFRAGINLIDFVYMLINKSPDRKNTKDLRHGLRAALDVVAANNNSSVDTAAAPPPENEATKGSAVRKAPKKGSTESKEQEPTAPIDLSDPVAKMNAAMKGLHERKLAADLARLAAEKQSPEIEEQRKKRAADAGSVANAAGAGPAGDSEPEGAELTVKWVLRHDNDAQQTGFPTVSLSLSAVNSWGAGDFSSSIPVTIVTGKSGKPVK